MRDAHVEFNGVWKKFHRGEVHDSLRDLIPALARRVMGRRPSPDELQKGDFWALRDVSFAAAPGQTLGIIGANGAGKSTVLKTLTKIIRPTRGSYAVRGRIGALIEVAAGFHPDLTGRENVFLQGAIMGMSGANVRAKFDQIVDFAGISEFIDTPVKRYSSGMSARLGFAVAAHLDPDVLIIDEVLSVGDFAFQERAFDRIRSMARSGLPVVLVSHQLDRVAELCTDALLLSRGQVTHCGTPADVIAAYLSGVVRVAEEDDSDVPIALHGARVAHAGPVRSGEMFQLRVRGAVLREPVPATMEPVGVSVRSAATGHVIFSSSSSRCGVSMKTVGPFDIDVALQMNVPPGVYVVETSVWDGARGRVVRSGPAINVRVTAGASFTGSVQMNPVMRLAPRDPTRPGFLQEPVSM